MKTVEGAKGERSACKEKGQETSVNRSPPSCPQLPVITDQYPVPASS